MPFATELRDAVEQAQPRPVTPVYPQVSEAIYNNVFEALQGNMSPDEAATKMNDEIEGLWRRSRAMEAPRPGLGRRRKRRSLRERGAAPGGDAVAAPRRHRLVAAYPIGYAIWLSLNEYSVRVAGAVALRRLQELHRGLRLAEFWDAVRDHVRVHRDLGDARARDRTRDGARHARGLQGPRDPAHGRARPVGGAHRRHRDHLAHDLRAEPGLATQVLDALGLPGPTSSGWARRLRAGGDDLADVWKTAPFMALLLLAGLQVIPDDVYDAAKVDGATTWQRFVSITLPLLMPAILVALIFRTLDALRIFDLPYVLTGGSNGTTTCRCSPTRSSPPTA